MNNFLNVNLIENVIFVTKYGRGVFNDVKFTCI
jgi:hypothetical protein